MERDHEGACMRDDMSYAEAVELLEHALRFGIDPSLEPIRAMCAQLGDPQFEYKVIQVAGTNGKTSTTRIVAALLRSCGQRVGLYVSPHLVEYPERIEIDGRVVDDETFARSISAAADAAQKAGLVATEFELLTAAALWIFAQAHVDWAVLECGLGGRWDATSVTDPQVAVITGVGLDHTAILGETLEEIAAEKAAIIKPESRAVLAHDLEAREIFEAQAKRAGVEVTRAGAAHDVEFSDDFMMPSYQRANVATAMAAVEAALGRELTDAELRDALRSVVLPGRFEVLREEPLVIVDAAHNPQSAEVLAGELARHPVPTLLLGVLADKDARGIVRALVPLFDRVVVTSSSSPRSIPAAELACVVEEECGVNPEVAGTIPEAVELLRGDSFMATGSITVAGEVKGIWC